MKKWLLLLLPCLFIAASVFAQKGDELLVYAVKGQVTAIFKDEESPVKIGKVLLPGTTLKTKKDASLTMLCKRGKPLCLTTEGTYPITKWKDSCKTTGKSLTANYFSFIWSEFYTYSPEHQDEMRKRNELAVTRGAGPKRIEYYPSDKVQITFVPGMDTVNYTGDDFPLSWSCFDYKGKYVFTLFESHGSKVIFADSVRETFMPIKRFSHLLKPGHSYKWTVMAPKAGFIKKRLLIYEKENKLGSYLNDLQMPVDVPEDSASTYFRVAFMLEKAHYLAEAFHWYEKATNTDPSIEVYRDKFIRFRNDFWIR